MTQSAMVPVQQGQNAPMALIGGEKLQLLTDTICKGASAGELGMFVEVCNRLRLDPFAKQIHAVKRWDSSLQREVFSFQVGIDGFRLVAQRTGDMDGVEGPFWCGPDGKWDDLWTLPDPPFAAKVAVYRKGIARPFIGIAKYESYVARKKDGQPNSMWQKFGDAMLAKCAEALALRKAFPVELSGVYTHEEMQQADTPAVQVAEPEQSRPRQVIQPPPALDPVSADEFRAYWFARLAECFPAEGDAPAGLSDNDRHEVQKDLFGHESLTELSDKERAKFRHKLGLTSAARLREICDKTVIPF